MIQILVFLVVATAIATVGVLVAQWVGLLPSAPKAGQFHTTTATMTTTARRGPAPPAGILALVCIGLWILFWIILLIVGVAYITAAS